MSVCILKKSRWNRPKEFAGQDDDNTNEPQSYVNKDMLPSSSDEDDYDEDENDEDENNNHQNEFQQKNPNAQK